MKENSLKDKKYKSKCKSKTNSKTNSKANSKTNSKANSKKIEGFRADNEGELDRSRDDNRFNMDEYDKSTIEAVKEGGTFAKLLLASFDFLVNKVICLFNDLFVVLFKDGFNMFGGNEKDKIKARNKKVKKIIENGGVVIHYTFIRYLITILVPPLGIFMSKGIRGWVNIILSIAFMYISYPLGIIYGLLISHNSYYADLFENHERKNIKEYKKKAGDQTDNQVKLLFIIFFILVITIIIIYFINKIKNNTFNFFK